MKITEALLSLWHNPRATINKLTIEPPSITKDLKIVLVIVFSLFLQIALFISLLVISLLDKIPFNEIPISDFLNVLAFKAFFWLFLASVLDIYFYAHITSLMILYLSKWFKGKGSIANTRTGILWSMVAFIPIGFSALSIMLSVRLEPNDLTFLGFLPFLLFPFVILYSLTLTLKITSEIQQFRLIYAFLTILCCAIIQGGLIAILFFSFR